ncbi:DcrB-related protein [Pantoea anthophila]|uniref:DcrB-related protein n=1 Tax=Pantoea anthophila TaxID=470931 RepID=UPI00289BAD29|nr:DcrB-related protein [Pantoea anthophila]
MSEYTLQDCNITVPDVFRDRTMNLFTLSHTNANEFTFVISRATAAAEDTLQSVSQRLSSELQATLQDLSLNHARLTELNGRQAGPGTVLQITNLAKESSFRSRGWY